MEAKINDTINALSDIRDHLRTMGDLATARDAAQAELTSIQTQLATATEDLSKAKAGLTVAQLKTLKEFEEASFAKRKEFEDLSVKADKAKATLDDLNANINTATQRHNQIEASIASLRKTLG